MIRPVRLLALAAALAAALAPAAHAGGNLATRAALADTTDQFVVTLKSPGTSAQADGHLMAVLASHGLAVLGERDGKLRLDRRIPHALAERIASQVSAGSSAVRRIAPDYWLTAQAAPNDPMYASQWHYFETKGGIRLPSAWNLSKGAGVTVAVLDTGYRPHADLAANIVAGYDMIEDTAVANDGNGRDSDASDPGDGCGAASSWHGTHVAGTIAAVTNNSLGVAGVAPSAKVQPVRVLGCGGGYLSDIEAGITWASGGTVSGAPANATPARVINMSLGGGGACSSTLQAAIDGAVSRGTVVVVSAGNSSANASGFLPANCNNVITVAATNRKGGRAWYSNFGSMVEIAAPGGDTTVETDGVLSTLNEGFSTPGADGYAYYQGTSMAAPHVSGVAALLLSREPTLTPAQVLTRLQSTARAFPARCKDCGAGIVNASKALGGR